jgi:RNA methyltransferase, TrmH family
MERIASRHNPIVRRFRDLARAGASADTMLLDGEHLLQEALGAAVTVEVAAFAERLAGNRLAALVARAAAAGVRTVAVTDQILAAISPVKNPTGAVALARRRHGTLDGVLAAPRALILLLNEVQDPGNVGAIVRVAEACGATGIVTSPGSADPFGWRALRGAMGSTFRMPIATRQSLADAITRARAAGLRVFATVPRGGTRLASADLREPAAVLLGGEGAGLPDALVAAAGDRLTIPMRSTVESLNVATAAALIVYEASRQRSES